MHKQIDVKVKGTPLTRSRTEITTQLRIPKNDSTPASLCTSVYSVYTPRYEKL